MEAYDEYVKNGITTYRFDDAKSYDIFRKYYNFKKEIDLRPDRVGADYYWLVDDERKYFIGEIIVRHKLNDALLQQGGHIGYGIRYSEWNRGYGSLMLQLALEQAKAIGFSSMHKWSLDHTLIQLIINMLSKGRLCPARCCG